MSQVSERLQRRIERDFDAEQVAEVCRLVAEASDTERVQAAIVLAAQCDVDAVRREAELAAVDWRDVLVNGELAGEDWNARMADELAPEAP